MPNLQPLPVFMEEAPQSEWRDGVYYVTGPTGVRVYREHTFLKAFHSAAKAIQDRHAATEAEVIQFPARLA